MICLGATKRLIPAALTLLALGSCQGSPVQQGYATNLSSTPNPIPNQNPNPNPSSNPSPGWPILLPQRTADDIALYAWLRTLAESDFDVPQTAETKITYSPAGASVRDLYGLYYGLQGTLPRADLLRYPSSAFVLNNGAGQGIEGDANQVRVLRTVSGDEGPNLEATFFYTLNAPGIHNPFYHHLGLANRLASQAVAMMLEINEQANHGTYGSYPEYVGMSVMQSLTAFQAAKAGAKGITPELRKAFYRTVNSIMNAWDSHSGPKDANTNMDTKTFYGLAMLYRGATEEGLSDIATNARELSAKWLLGSRSATDPGAAPGKLDHYIFHSAGYIGERSMPETSYNGISLYYLAKAALVVKGIAGWEWLWDRNGVVDRMAKFKSYQIFRDPDGWFNGPSGYAIRTGAPYAQDQSAPPGRDLMVAALSDHGKEHFYKRSMNPTKALTAFIIPSLANAESTIQNGLSIYGDNAFTPISPVYQAITSASIRWWAGRVSTIAIEHYQPSLYDTIASLISSSSSKLQLPSLRTGEHYNIPFGRDGESPDFWTFKSDDGAGTEFAVFIESFSRDPDAYNGYSSWRGGGSIQSFWTSKAGLVINTRNSMHSNPAVEWPAVETWATHHLWGTLADGTVFSSAQRDTRLSSYAYDSNTVPTQVIATNTPDRASGSYTGTVGYQRTISKLTDGLKVTTKLDTDSRDSIATLWESIPIYKSIDKPTNAVTTIEYWDGSAWSLMPAPGTLVTTAKVRLGRDHALGPAYVYIEISSPQKVKLAQEWCANYQAADYFQQLMIDLHPNSGTAQPLAHVSVTYTIRLHPDS